MLLHDAKHGRKAQSRGCAGLLRGEKRLEDPRQIPGRYPAAGVANRQADELAPPSTRVSGRLGVVENRRRGPDRQPAAVGHRIAGVLEQIHHHLFHHDSVRRERGQPRGQAYLDADLLTSQAPEHLRDFRDVRVDVHPPLVDRMPAAEEQELPHEIPGPHAGCVYLPHLFSHFRGQLPAVEKQLGIAGDDRQSIVELAGDARSDLSEGLHLLRLGEEPCPGCTVHPG